MNIRLSNAADPMIYTAKISISHFLFSVENQKIRCKNNKSEDDSPFRIWVGNHSTFDYQSIYVVYSISFQAFLYRYFKLSGDSWKFTVLFAIYLMRWLSNFYDFRFKSTATAEIGIHPTKADYDSWVNFKNATWHFRNWYTIKLF